MSAAIPQPGTAGTAACLSCLDKGWRMVDGTPSPCACDAGRAWQKRAYPGDGPWQGPNNLPPGGDVLLAQARREAAGVPVGAESGAPVRAMLIDDVLVQGALEHIAALAGELGENVPARRAALEWLAALPEHYRQTVPPVRTPPSRRNRHRGGQQPAAGAMPLVPPPPQ